MARTRKTNEVRTEAYRHSGDKRKNIPPAKIASEGEIPAVKKVRYHYSPHLSPELRFDQTGNADKVLAVKEKIGQYLTEKEKELLDQALASQQPWLEWAGKREQHDRGWFDVDPVALHIHERVSAQAIVRAAMREDLQRDLFADPELEYQKAVQFYKHDIDWANRLILGDSLQVMSSLACRENLAGKVQMIYLDPPYGIRFASNFQVILESRDVKDKETDFTREAEMVKAYRDTWTLGTHSYLTYLRDRFLLCRELLAESGSIFVQISDVNCHNVRVLLDEIFGAANFVSQISYKTASPLGAKGLAGVCDYLLWYAKSKPSMKFRQLFEEKEIGEGTEFAWVEECTGHRRRMTKDEQLKPSTIGADEGVFSRGVLYSSGYTPSCIYDFDFNGRKFSTEKKSWRTHKDGMRQLIACNRLVQIGELPYFVQYHADFPFQPLRNLWSDTRPALDKAYVVQTDPKVIQRCLMMTTDPGDLVFDPTCGSGTTAYIAESWGRRWITCDTSRIALSIARERLLTARYEYFALKDELKGVTGGLRYKSIPHVFLKDIANNSNIVPIIDKHEPFLLQALDICNKALGHVSESSRTKLKQKLQAKQASKGKRSTSDADERRWNLPERFDQWTVPFDTDEDWPKALQDAVTAYRKVWRAKMDAVNACIKANADQEEFVDQPEVVKGILRVSGPFTVEGVRPEELSMSDDGSLFDPTQNDWEQNGPAVEPRNITAYLSRMMDLIRKDGVTFPNNRHQMFSRVESLFEERSGTELHAEAIWEGTSEKEANNVAIAFGPQYGPVTASQVEELIRSSRRYDELVIAGFSFDAASTEIIQDAQHPKLKIHMAHIRPDVSPGMDGLLKDTPNSQLFTVFGQPEIKVKTLKDGSVQVQLLGVDIYDPLKGEVKSSGADKVAAWFLDGDYDGRCFCITQAFFPNQDAWEKIAKALGSSADVEAFASFKGTESITFKPGKHRRIAVKVIDPRGNEVVAIEKLGDA